MVGILVAWAVSTMVILGLAVLAGVVATKHPLGLLIDTRGRYCLTHLQVAVWSVVMLSVVTGTFAGRWAAGVPGALAFDIPPEFLAVLGIILTSAVLSTVIKITKDATRPRSVAVNVPNDHPAAKNLSPSEIAVWRPRLVQVLMQEEGAAADRVIDILKFQDVIITLVLATVYIGSVIQELSAAGQAARFTALPGFSNAFLGLMAISNIAYLAGKCRTQTGTPTLSLASRDAAEIGRLSGVAQSDALGGVLGAAKL